MDFAGAHTSICLRAGLVVRDPVWLHSVAAPELVFSCLIELLDDTLELLSVRAYLTER